MCTYTSIQCSFETLTLSARKGLGRCCFVKPIESWYPISPTWHRWDRCTSQRRPSSRASEYQRVSGVGKTHCYFYSSDFKYELINNLRIVLSNSIFNFDCAHLDNQVNVTQGNVLNLGLRGEKGHQRRGQLLAQVGHEISILKYKYFFINTQLTITQIQNLTKNES